MPHVAFLGGLALPTKLEGTGGLEVWSSLFLTELAKRDYIFDFFAAEGSLEIPGKINLHALTKPLFPLMDTHPFFNEYIPKHSNLSAKEYYIDYIGSLSLKLQNRLIAEADKYDFLIDSSGASVVGTNWDLFPKPVIVVNHFGEASPNMSLFQLLPIPKNIHFVMLTDIQYHNTTWIPANQKSVIPHGVDISDFTFSPTSLESLTWMGRISPEKGLEDALTVASSLEKDITVFGYKQYHGYFDEKIQPLVSDRVTLIENNYQHKHRNKCKAFLMPIHWEEPFGISAIEAMACGTPVIAYARGSMPELIQDGVTGFLVNPSDTDIRGNFQTKATGINGLIEATKKLYSLSEKEYKNMRYACRKVVEEKYSLTRMIDSYDKLFQRVAPTTHKKQ